MRSRTLLLIVLAIVLAGGTAMLARSWLANERSREIASASPLPLPTPAKSVLVARSDLKRGQLLKPEDLVWQVWPEGGLSSNYIVIGAKTPESFAGWVVRDPINAGEPITEKKVVAPGNRGFLAAVLRPGMRAVAVSVTLTTGGTGFIFPGDLVDVLITYSVQVTDPDKPNSNQTNDHKVAETVLRNVRVIAMDTKTESKAGEVVAAHTATLEVTPKQGEIVSLAGEMGKVSLVLRSLANGTANVAAATPAPGDFTKVAAGDPPSESSQVVPDSANTIDATYTVDSEVSALLRPLGPQSQDKKSKKNSDNVTILRGGGKGSESVNPDSASKGS